MHEKDLGISEYLDLYGAVLEERQRYIMDLYYNEDYSLSEISEDTGITRQGVSESIRKSSKKLRDMEEKLRFKSRIDAFEAEKDRIAVMVKEILDSSADNNARTALNSLISALARLDI